MSQCELVKPGNSSQQTCSSNVNVNKVMSQEKIDDRQDKLKAMIDEANCTISSTERDSLFALLSEYHDVFSLDDNERGETDLVQLTIDTGEAPPQRQSARRIPFAAQEELAHLLETMQNSGVIKPSESPWALGQSHCPCQEEGWITQALRRLQST